MAGKKGMRLRSWGSLTRLPSGRWRAAYTGPDLARHAAPVTFTAKLDGEYWLASERRLIERDDWTPPRFRADQVRAKSKTLGDFAKEWVEQRSVKPRTKAGYESTLANHITPKLGGVPLNMLNAETVRKWYAGMDATKPTARAHAYQLLHSVCATAVSDGLLTTQPCQIARAMSTPTKRTAPVLSVEDVAKLAGAIRPERMKCLVLISAWCGLRWGEVTELRRKDLSADCSVVTVSRAVTHRGACRIDTVKSSKAHVVVVPPHIRDDLADHLAHNVAEGAEALLFPPAMGGCHVNDKVFKTYFDGALKSISHNNVRVHDLRHFAGTQTARVANLVETMQRLGHSTAKASLIYQQVASGRPAEIAAALSELATSVELADAEAEQNTA